MSETTNIAPAAKNASNSSWPGAWTAYRQAWKGMRENMTPVVIYVVAYALAGILGSDVHSGIDSLDTNNSYEGLVSLIFLVALPVYGLAIADRRKLDFGAFMKTSVVRYLSMLAAMILFALIVGISVVLLILPVIWTLAWFWLTPFAIVDKDVGPIEGLKESRRITRNHKGKVWSIIGTSLLLAIAASPLIFVPYASGIAFGLIIVWIHAASGILYRWLEQNGKAEA